MRSGVVQHSIRFWVNFVTSLVALTFVQRAVLHIVIAITYKSFVDMKSFVTASCCSHPRIQQFMTWILLLHKAGALGGSPTSTSFIIDNFDTSRSGSESNVMDAPPSVFRTQLLGTKGARALAYRNPLL